MNIETLEQLEGFAKTLIDLIVELPENLTMQISARGKNALLNELIHHRCKKSIKELDSKIYYMTKAGIRFKIKLY